MYTKAQQAFIQQRTQQQLIAWCDQAIKAIHQGDPKPMLTLNLDDPLVRYACDRKTPWLSHKGDNNFFILSPGWAAATSYLKR